MVKLDVDWVCEECGNEWGARPGVRKRCPSCGSRQTFWKDMSEPSEEHEHQFVPSPDNPLYCNECGASETDHRL